MKFKTLQDFNDYFNTEKICYSFLESILWENNTQFCPHCNSKKYYKVKSRNKFKDIPSYRCADRRCDLPYTIRTNTIFEGSKIELRKWFQALYEISTSKKGISSIELSKRIGVSQKTAWLMNHKIRTLLKNISDKTYNLIEIGNNLYNGNYIYNNGYNFIGTLKRGVDGIYHYMSPQHLDLYCNEFSGRYNNRHINNIELFKHIIKNSFNNNNITYDELISKKKNNNFNI